MDYEKKYKEALDLMKDCVPDENGLVHVRPEDIFSELAESDDERIKKELIENFKWFCGDFPETTKWGKDNNLLVKDIIAWLEKQGENHIEQDLEMVVKPMFNVGDWIVSDKPYINNDYRLCKVVGISDGCYIIQTINKLKGYNTFKAWESEYHLWSIKDAKDGDVLACESGWTCIFKTLVNDENFSSYCFMDNTKWVCETGSECHTLKEEFVKAYNGKIYPATKEQCDTLMKAMADAGWEFDFEKKELKKIEQEELSVFEKSLKHIIEEAIEEGDTHNLKADAELLLGLMQKPYGQRKECLDCQFNYVGGCKGSCAMKRSDPNPAWSEEDERQLNTTIAYLKDAKEFKKMAENCIDWLKSLKQRYTWKPSKEQMKALHDMNLTGNISYAGQGQVLIELYNDLKKL